MTRNNRYYITTAIPFVNARPHIGHALEFVLTDALARYHRLKGENVRFLTGADENSLKNVQAAEREGVLTQTLVDRNAAHFYALRDSLNLSFDDFIRTSVEPRHLGGVVKLWQACDQAGDIYRRAYRGLYCVGASSFTPTTNWSPACARSILLRRIWLKKKITSSACPVMLTNCWHSSSQTNCASRPRRAKTRS